MLLLDYVKIILADRQICHLLKIGFLEDPPAKL